VIELRIIESPSASDGKSVANRGDDYAYKIIRQILNGIARRPYVASDHLPLVAGFRIQSE